MGVDQPGTDEPPPEIDLCAGTVPASHAGHEIPDDGDFGGADLAG